MVRYRFLIALLAVLLTGFVPGRPESAGGADCLTAYDLGNSPTALAVADFNGDGDLDLVAANRFGPHVAGHQVWVMLGTGSGRFGAPTAYEAGPGPASLAVGDFNGDDHEDLAVMNSFSSRPTSQADTVTVLLGTGSGTFAPPVAYSVGVDTDPVSVVAGDFNADGRLDLVVVNRVFTASVLLGVGDGSFGAVTTHALTGTSPPALLSAVASDVNGDGHPDLVAADAGHEAILVRLGNGAGGFDDAIVHPAGATPTFVAPGDFNGDDNVDLAVASSYENTVSVLLGTGGGSFGSATAYRVRTAPGSVAVGDIDADGRPDLAVANAYDDTVSVLLGTGDGGFAADSAYGVGRLPVSVVAGDFDGDGRSDLAAANSADDTVSVLSTVGTCVEATPRMCVGDCNSDGAVTIAELLTMVNIALGNASIAACPAASSWVPTADPYGLSVPDLIKAVADALYGCASCAPGTCRVSSEARCEAPTGPVGNACCRCRYDGWCAFTCICASPDTPIATPHGDVPIASLEVGDLVYSTSGAGIVAVPVLQTHRQAVESHHVVQVRLATGAVLEISAGHPTADGRTFGELRVGNRLGDVPIVGVQVIPYRHDYTYDILPASDSGVYFAAGVPVGSTLHPR